MRPGVYVPAPVGDGPARRREAEVLASVRGVVERLTTSYWLSHETAALLWGCWTWRLGPQVHVTQLSNPSTRRDADPRTRRHWTALPHRDRAVLDGIPVTTLERTVVDCARSLRTPSALVVADSALRLGADPAILGQIVDESAGKRGVVRARQVLALADARSESPGETLLRWIALDAGLPPLTPQVAVSTWRGTFRLDLAWQEIRLGLEFDGAVKYDGSSGAPLERLLAEKTREDALREAGWTILRVTWHDLSDPSRLEARLRAALRRARERP
ncbi:type IV toxin-antitoxin system AbiEi family antitoxin domain-containing protein [Oerskovia turbata]